MTLMGDKQGKPYERIAMDYNPKDHIASRIRSLQEARYLEMHGDQNLTNRVKSRCILALVGFLQPDKGSNKAFFREQQPVG